MKLIYELFLARTSRLGCALACPLATHGFLFLSNLRGVGHRSSARKVPILPGIASALPFALFPSRSASISLLWPVGTGVSSSRSLGP